jgi:membrane glycosyltransferase
MNLHVPFSEPTSDGLTVPRTRPIPMPVRPAAVPPRVRPLAPLAASRQRRRIIAVVLFAVVALLAAAMGSGLARDGFSVTDAVIFALFVPSITWIGFSAVIALSGALTGAHRLRDDPPRGWLPAERTAVLIPARNEDVAALRRRIVALRRDLAREGLATAVDLFVLSDSDAPGAIAAEEALAIELAAPYTGPRLYYRRREDNAGRKPGNIADWVRRWGGAYGQMLVLDADSVMSARRIRGLIHRMEVDPRLGLIQTGVRLTGAETRFGRLQQRAARLYGPAYAAGLATFIGREGNFWGHNALIRVRAFAQAAGLPRLPGRPPFGGDILSHDFVEAAWLRRAGWAVVLEPDSRGSAEGGPQSLAAFHKRDRRWCQGNLQHLRLLSARGLHPVSRVHLLGGIAGYLASPVWLALVVTAILAGASDGMILPALGALGLILAQKAAGVVLWLRRRPGLRTARIVLSLAAGELVVSTLLAPTIMLRQTLAVISVFSGQDCGWKPAGNGVAGAAAGEAPWLEPAAGLALLAAAIPVLGTGWTLLLVAPIVLPLVAAPVLVPVLDLPPGWRPTLAGITTRLALPRYAVQR